MITLYQFPPAYGLPNASPFCMKVETYLRMAGLPYRSEYGFHIPKAPKGKLPYIEDDGRVIADSGLILDYLKATHGNPLDGHLSPAERATALAFVRLLDEHFFWAGGVQPRWVEAAGWQVTRAAFFQGLSGPMALIVPLVAPAICVGICMAMASAATRRRKSRPWRWPTSMRWRTFWEPNPIFWVSGPPVWMPRPTPISPISWRPPSIRRPGAARWTVPTWRPIANG